MGKDDSCKGCKDTDKPCDGACQEQEACESGCHGCGDDSCESMDPTESLLVQIHDLTTTLKYLQADYENYRKRVDRDKEDYQSFANKDLLNHLLPIIDTFELAIKSSPKDDTVKGFELVYAQLIGTLEQFGMRPIPAVGRYDPKLHEALLQEPSDKPKGEILEVLQKGFMLKDKVIRPAKVKISS